MSQKNGFGNGFILGSIVGGVVGGLLGSVLASRTEKRDLAGRNEPLLRSGEAIPFSDEENIELARHGLEDKIAQLNLAIDDVRQQLGSVNRNSGETE